LAVDAVCMKYWDLFIWSKHEYRYRLLGVVIGDTAREAIRMAKQVYPEIVMRNDVMRVVPVEHTPLHQQHRIQDIDR